MNFILCTSYVMWFIEDIKKYVNFNTRVWPKYNKNSLSLWNSYRDERFTLCRKYEYNNYIIDLLIEKWIIDKPVMIRSPRSLKRKQNWGVLAPWLYFNWYGSIFYNDGYDYPLILWDLELKPWGLTDTIIIAVLSWELWHLLDINKNVLKANLSECKFSEMPSTIE